MTTDNDVHLGRDLVSYLTGYPQLVAFGDEDAAVVFDRYHAAGFEMVNDGVPLDRERLLAHVRPARRNATSVQVEVLDTVTGVGQVAARYVLTAVMRQGHTVATEIYMFGQLAADGRLQRVDQVTRNLPATAQP